MTNSSYIFNLLLGNVDMKQTGYDLFLIELKFTTTLLAIVNLLLLELFIELFGL